MRIHPKNNGLCNRDPKKAAGLLEPGHLDRDFATNLIQKPHCAKENSAVSPEPRHDIAFKLHMTCKTALYKLPELQMSSCVVQAWI